MSVGKVGSNYAAILERAAELRKAAQQKEKGASKGPEFKAFDLNNKTAGNSVGDKLGSALEQVSTVQNNADSMVIDLASGKDVNLHNTMIELEKADIALKYTVQLRNRALSAYQELMQLQV
ncbi:MAG: flagellar hook-basal body complex protein FliE [Rickettsiales bacterium]|nr:flagellar hook-basal body complex protein FliE [Rickettsiales bacterium]|tara:strand:- start:661 stop:1023 length:363 start_codon:yes stop_codon:yes gene_type:complete